MKLGIFDDTNEEYHAQDHVGSTSLKQIANSSRHFYIAWKGWEKKENKNFDEGSAVHSVLLEKTLSAYIKKPEGTDGRTKEGKAVIEELKASGKIILDAAVYDSMEERERVFSKSKEAMKVYKLAEIEKSHYVQDEETGLYLKCRPDINNVAIHGEMADLKSTANMKFFEKDIFKYGYHISAGFYSIVSQISTGLEVEKFKFIAQEKTVPYGIKVFTLEYADLQLCKMKARELINRVSVAIKENVFPSYEDIETTIKIPSWVSQPEAYFEEEV